MRTTRHARVAAAALASAIFAPTPAAQDTAEPVHLGTYRFEITGIERPAAAAIDAQERVYVVEELARRVSVFDKSGARVRAFGEIGPEYGELLEPQGIAVAADGRVFVADTGNDRICVFDPEGRFVRSIGRRGTGPSELNHPLGLALAGDRLYVADCRNHRVQVFDDAGGFLREIGRRGRGKGELFHPAGVAVDSTGSVYVADLDNQRVQKFDGEGRFAASFGDFGPYPGFFTAPSGIACAQDRIYVADRDNHRVQAFDARGRVLYEWGLHVLRPREGAGKLHYPNHVAIAPSGTFAVVVESVENRCQVFEARSEDAPAPLVQDKSAAAHYGAGIDVRGDLCTLVEPSSPGALAFDVSTQTPIEITRFGSFGTKPGAFVRPIDAALTSDARSVWISDPGSARLSLYSLAREPGEPLRYDPLLARFVKSIDLVALSAEASADAPWPIEPGAIECDARGDIYVADVANARIVVIDGTTLAIRRVFGRRGRAMGELLRPTSIAVSRSGERTYVVDAAARRVLAFDREGRALHEIRGEGLPGGLTRPFGCAVASDGSVFVTDEGADLVAKFDERGRLVSRFGARGLGRAEFFEPQGIACDRADVLWIVDAGNHRVQVLTADGAFRDAFGARLYVQPALAEPR